MIKLTSYGFTRRKGLDFKFGKNFKGYDYKGLEFTYSYRNSKGNICLFGVFYRDIKEDLNLDLLKLGNKIRQVLHRYDDIAIDLFTSDVVKSYCKDLDEVIEDLKEYNKLKDSITEITIYQFKDLYLYNQTDVKTYKEGLVSTKDLDYFKRYFPNLSLKIVELIEKK